jgi:hypothetical protein
LLLKKSRLQIIWTKAGVAACFCLLLLSLGCKPEKDQPLANQAPLVRIAIDSVGVPDSVSLTTRIKLSWSGQDADGYIEGFKISWGTDSLGAAGSLSSSALIAGTDSTFLFNFSGSLEKAIIHFFIQSVDNKGAASAVGHLRIPVKNSFPEIRFIADGMPAADTLWSVIALPYFFSDPDGSQNVDSVFVKINDGNWTPLPKNLGFISLVPVNPSAIGVTSCFVYGGENLSSLPSKPAPISNLTVPGLKLDDLNTIYLKVKDQAGAEGKDTTEKSYFVKRKSGDVLLVNAFAGIGSNYCDTLYSRAFSELNIPFDKINLIRSNGINQPRFWNSQFYLLCQIYGKIFWYGDVISSAPGAIPVLLNPASTALKQFLRFDGKMLGSNTFPDAPFQLPTDDPVFELVPIDTFTRFTNNVRIKPGGILPATQSGFPDLVTGRLLTGGDIFKVKPGADSLYYVPKNMMSNIYPGPVGLPIALRTKNIGGKTNLVFFTIEMAYLNGNRSALLSTFNKIINDEFNW